MGRTFLHIYFTDSGSITIAFSSKDIGLYKRIKKMSGEQIKRIVGHSLQEIIVSAAENERSVNAEIKYRLKQKI